MRLARASWPRLTSSRSNRMRTCGSAAVLAVMLMLAAGPPLGESSGRSRAGGNDIAPAWEAVLGSGGDSASDSKDVMERRDYTGKGVAAAPTDFPALVPRANKPHSSRVCVGRFLGRLARGEKS